MDNASTFDDAVWPMTYIRSAAAVSRIALLTSQQTGNTLASPLTVPAITVDQEIVHRTLTTAATDFLFTANQAGRNVIMSFSNDNASTVNMTISAQASETISGPVSALNTAPAQTYILLPGESLTLENTGNAAWTQIV